MASCGLHNVFGCYGDRNRCPVLGIRPRRRSTAFGDPASHVDPEERTPCADVVFRQHADRPHYKPLLEGHRRRGLSTAAQFTLMGCMCT